MSTTVAAGSTVSFYVGAFDTLTLNSSAARGTLALTSAAPKLLGNQALGLQSGTFGPWGVPMTALLTVTAGSLDYTVNFPLTASVGASIATSRSALASDNGGTFGLPTGVTYTIADTSLIPAGAILQGDASSGGTIAVGGSVTINGGTASIALTARQVAVLLPTPGSTTDLTVKVAY